MKFTIFRVDGEGFFLVNRKGFVQKMTIQPTDFVIPKNADSLITYQICKGCGKVADKSFSSTAEMCDACVPCEEFAAGM